jgi:hypothetical protein
MRSASAVFLSLQAVKTNARDAVNIKNPTFMR